MKVCQHYHSSHLNSVLTLTRAFGSAPELRRIFAGAARSWIMVIIIGINVIITFTNISILVISIWQQPGLRRPRGLQPAASALQESSLSPELKLTSILKIFTIKIKTNIITNLGHRCLCVQFCLSLCNLSILLHHKVLVLTD